MPLATKNGSLIVKNGSIAENCGCCGGWYCNANDGGRCPCLGVNFLCQAPGCRPRFVTASVVANFSQDVVQYGGDFIRFPPQTFSGTFTLDNTRTLFGGTANQDEYAGRFFGADAASLGASEARIVFYPNEQYAAFSMFRKIESLSFIANDPCVRNTGIGSYYDVVATSTGSGGDQINYVAFLLFNTTLGFSATGHCYGTGSSTAVDMNQGDFDLASLSKSCAERGISSIAVRSGFISNNATWTFINSYT